MSNKPNNEPEVEEGFIPSDPLTGHVYDGIQEFDNPMPGWWKMLFWASIVFCIPYLMYFHLGVESRTMAGRYEIEVARNMEVRFGEIGELPADEETLLTYMGKPDWVAYGKSVFAGNCSSCHAADGGGLNGPNLCDEAYKNVKEVADIIKIVQAGAGNGAMPAWQGRLVNNDIVLVSAYVASLRGSNPANPKPPLGNPIPEWPPIPAEESTTDLPGE